MAVECRRRATLTGDRTQFPGMELFVERPENENKSPQLVAGYNPNDNGKGPWDLFRKEHFEVDGQVVSPR